MRSDDWHMTEDVDHFLARAGDFLRSRPALHTMPLTVTDKLRTGGVGEYEATVFGWLEQGDAVGGIFYRRPTHRLSLALLSPDQAEPWPHTWPTSANPSPASPPTTTPRPLSRRRGSGTRAQRRYTACGSVFIASAR
jgi:hypothetical protein